MFYQYNFIFIYRVTRDQHFIELNMTILLIVSETKESLCIRVTVQINE